MFDITLDSGAVVSISAANKKQLANAEILFGKNAKLIVKKIDELVKIKELDTAKLAAVLDLLNDADATTALAKKAAGKNLVTAMKNLYKAKTLVATINGLRAIKIKPVAIRQDAPAKTSRPVRAKTVDANGKIERNKWYVVDHTRHANDTIIKGPYKTKAEADKNVETGKDKRVIIQEAMTGQNCLDEGLTWTQSPNQKQTGGTPGAKTVARNQARSESYDNLYNALMRGGEGENVKALFKLMKLPAPNKSVTASVANMGGEEDCIFVMSETKKIGIVLGPSGGMIGEIKQARGRGAFTVAKYNPTAGAPSDLPKSAFKQLGNFTLYSDAYAAFYDAVKAL
ncbi:hypothetical protein pEaSNUABM23_00175 [Erwinia phage pEa_SNUABM_23]|nr:hypothetical protein pEaSNUABM23_00175 [Erwinia phage pEa_SNUABM_23]UIW10853.1 hypothetical protein pEaSNUABM23_00175 [Erwinia phage pEa_SNUABM_31]